MGDASMSHRKECVATIDAPMAHVRMFAQAREIAGRGVDTIHAETLGELLDIAVRKYGPEFSAVLSRATVWVNGEQPEDGHGTLLRTNDEVAILPPVSGGRG